MPQQRDYEQRERRSSRSSYGEERSAQREESARRTQSDRRKRKKPSAGRTASLVLLYVAGVIRASVLLACVGWILAGDVLARNKEPKTVTITISNEDSFGDVVNRLEDEGLIEYKWLFKLFAANTGGGDDVTMGTYTLNTDMDYRALLSGMRATSATKAEVTITITEGMNLSQIFDLMEDRGVASKEDLMEQAANYGYAFDFLQDIPLGDANRLEGFLYPDTYQFYTPHNTVYAINKLLVRFDEVYDETMREQVANSGYSLREILTIASLIERETDGEDQDQIASVIYNRLNNPDAGTQGYLQIDATLGYINGGKQPTEADKSIDSPYNTYKYKGLPPAPIANPGKEAIQAALNPASTDYFYYALGDDGKHHYFKTYDQMQSFLSAQELYNG